MFTLASVNTFNKQKSVSVYLHILLPKDPSFQNLSVRLELASFDSLMCPLLPKSQPNEFICTQQIQR